MERGQLEVVNPSQVHWKSLLEEPVAGGHPVGNFSNSTLVTGPRIRAGLSATVWHSTIGPAQQPPADLWPPAQAAAST